MGKTKDKRDIYYRKAKESGFRARSAFKLMQIAEEFGLFKNVYRVVDLCAAPGSWSQVLSKELYQPYAQKLTENPQLPEDQHVKIVAVDLQEIAPIQGVTIIKGDITKKSVAEDIINRFEGQLADLVVSDGAPDVTGLHDIDQYVQSHLILAGLNITTHLLKKGGNFLAKIFRGKDISLMYCQLKLFFSTVTVVKPRSSRNSSLEAFILCQDYQPPKDYQPTMINPLLLDIDYKENLSLPRADSPSEQSEKSVSINELVVPFLACGDLSGFDSDKIYELPDEYEAKKPLQTPINPPYTVALELRKKNMLDDRQQNPNKN